MEKTMTNEPIKLTQEMKKPPRVEGTPGHPIPLTKKKALRNELPLADNFTGQASPLYDPSKEKTAQFTVPTEILEQARPPKATQQLVTTAVPAEAVRPDSRPTRNMTTQPRT